MKKYIGEFTGKTLVLNLQMGDFILETIREQCKAEGIQYGVVITGIASCDRISCHRVATTGTDPRDEFFDLEAPIEIASIQGVILEGKPHLHVSFADLEKGYAAHLEEGTRTLYTAEIVIAELKGLEGVTRIYAGNGIPEFTKEKGEIA